MIVFTFSVGTTKLTIRSLNNYILNTIIATHWNDLGTELLKENYVHELKNIETNYRDVKIRCKAMFKYWLQVDCDANWNQLINALKRINQHALAFRIKNDVLKGIVNDYSCSYFLYM